MVAFYPFHSGTTWRRVRFGSYVFSPPSINGIICGAHQGRCLLSEVLRRVLVAIFRLGIRPVSAGRVENTQLVKISKFYHQDAKTSTRLFRLLARVQSRIPTSA
jgi:hypothetical protein